MIIVSFAEARNCLEVLLDTVVSYAGVIVISRRDSQNVVVMSLRDYNSLMETLHLLKSPVNAEHLRKSIEQFNATKFLGNGI